MYGAAADLIVALFFLGGERERGERGERERGDGERC